MATRGRKSAASLSVVVGSIDGRPQPPAGLTEFQKELWQRTVAGEPLDQFRTATLQQLLKEYVRHAEAAHILAEEIAATDVAWLRDEDGLKRYDKLLAMRGYRQLVVELQLRNAALTFRKLIGRLLR